MHYVVAVSADNLEAAVQDGRPAGLPSRFAAIDSPAAYSHRRMCSELDSPLPLPLVDRRASVGNVERRTSVRT